ncbi:hypothetical protein L4D09_04085 [Photobacterium makurazakiensis]|uniref:hypothetical protein n=1 Tax=Photobacterium makurazakiensis TaxID=2910234 RepID=UPI003D12F184
MIKNANLIKWLLHGLTVAPLVHILIGLPVFFILFAGSVSYAVGSVLTLFALFLPIDFIHSLAMTYMISGKLLIGVTLYSGWPLTIICLVPTCYLLSLAILGRYLRNTNFEHWIAYNIATTWRVIVLSAVALLIPFAGGLSFSNAAIFSAIISACYLLIRIYHFYVPLWSRIVRWDHNHNAFI